MRACIAGSPALTTPRADELRALLIRNHETAETTPFVRGSARERVGA